MNIGIDITDLSNGVVGVGVVIENMLDYFSENGSGHNFFLYQNGMRDYFRGRSCVKRNLNLKLYDYAKEQILFGALTYIDKLDIFHAPIHLPPKIYNRKTKIVMTIHDFHIETDRELYHAEMVRYFYPKRLEAVKRADKVIVHTGYVRDKVLEFTGIDENKIALIPNSVKREYVVEYSDKQKEEIKCKYNLPDKFILYVGSIEPWKRVSFLIKAFKKFKSGRNSDYSLVIAGRPGGSEWENKFVRESSEKNEDILWLGYVEQPDLPLIYKSAELFCSASLLEGFGIIFAEAIVSGLPIVAVKSTAIPSVVRDGGILVEKDDLAGFSEAIDRILFDNTLRNSIMANVEKLKEIYACDIYGETVLKIYESLI